MKNLKISCPCLFGLESTLTFEAKKLGFKNIETNNGRISFNGDFSDVASANINLRTAERVQIILKEFKATTFDELFEQVLSIPFEDYIDKNEAFPVTGYTLDSTLASMSDIQSIIKKAVVSRMQTKHEISWFEESGKEVPIHFSLRNDWVLIMLDTTGWGLHKRGYRKTSVMAPIKETLAAGIIDIARIRGDSIIFDPMCGSGTIVIEAATKALNIAPGLNRDFLFAHWQVIKNLPEDILEIEKTKAKALENRDVKFQAFASDIDSRSVALTKENVKRAGISSFVSVSKADVKDFYYPGYGGTIITNPPYGERLLEQSQVEDLYKMMGKVFTKNIRQYIITSYKNFESVFNKKADRRRKLYNGMIPCQLYMYFKDAK